MAAAGTATDLGGDYFSLEVFVHAVELTDPAGAFAEATWGAPDAAAFPRIPYAVSFQFLDYPLLLVYAKEPVLQASALAYAQHAYPHDYLAFDAGKSCMLQADAGEMQFLLEQVCLGRSAPQYVYRWCAWSARGGWVWAAGWHGCMAMGGMQPVLDGVGST